jgi:3-oxoadipyl-CoA thiolase
LRRLARGYSIHLGWRFLNAKMKERYGVDTVPQTGENVASEFGISRADQDAFALRSQQRVAEVQRSGYFREEIIAVQVADPKRGSSVEVV